MADILSMVNGVIGMGERGRQMGQQSRLASLMGQAYQAPRDQRGGYIAQMMATDPNAGLAANKAFDGMDDSARQQLGQYASVFDSVPEDQKPAAYAQLAQQAKALGLPVPDEYKPEYAPHIAKIAEAFGRPGNASMVQSTRIGADGFYWTVDRSGNWTNSGIKADPRTQLRDQPGIAPGIVDLRTGTVAPLADGVQPAPAAPQPPRQPSGGDPFASLLAAAPNLRITSRNRTPEQNARAGGVPNSYHLTGQAIDIGTPSPQEKAVVKQWAAQNDYEFIDNYADGHVHLEPRGQPQQAQFAQGGVAAPRPAVSPAESERLRLAREANERAAQAAARAEGAAALAKRGNAPAGYRFKADGSLEPIPGGPKPAGSVATEGERKAAVLLQRLDGSLAQLEAAVRENPSADSPSVLAEVGRSLPFVGDVAANALNTSERQRVEAAQLDILDAALTLGTGAAYTREQLEGYRRSFFPQIGDSAATIQDKTSRLQNVIQAAKLAAGRAAPQTQQSGGQRSAQQGWSIQKVAD